MKKYRFQSVRPVTHLYCDGGTLGKNPSTHGGTWAWCLVKNDKLLRWNSGLLLPSTLNLPKITNNLSELWAVIEGLSSTLEFLNGNRIRILTDSRVTFFRVQNLKASMLGVPIATRRQLHKMLKEIPDRDVVLLKGHPERLKGKKTDLPISKFNVLCDDLCRKQAEHFFSR